MKLFRICIVALTIIAGSQAMAHDESEQNTKCYGSYTIKPASNIKSLLETFGPYAGILAFYIYALPSFKTYFSKNESTFEGVKKILDLCIMSVMYDKVKEDGKTLYAIGEYIYDSTLNL